MKKVLANFDARIGFTIVNRARNDQDLGESEKGFVLVLQATLTLNKDVVK